MIEQFVDKVGYSAAFAVEKTDFEDPARLSSELQTLESKYPFLILRLLLEDITTPQIVFLMELAEARRANEGGLLVVAEYHDALLKLKNSQLNFKVFPDLISSLLWLHQIDESGKRD